jgi:hypothetical protein
MFEHIVSHGIYNLDGLAKIYSTAAANSDRGLVQFPQGAKEIKAQWYPIPDSQKGRYLWREAQGPDGKTYAYGLVSLHIITKDLQNWFWADFGHVDCETQTGACDNQWLASIFKPFGGQEPAQTQLRDSTTVDTRGIRKETAGTFWENYRLRGTQTNFVNADGEQTVLSNPVIEDGFQNSSCMSCHARASIGSPIVLPNKKTNTLNPGDPTLGPPDPALFGAGPGMPAGIKYLQTDFIWSAPFRAHSCSVAGGCGN